jgi:hypothetical protein
VDEEANKVKVKINAPEMEQSKNETAGVKQVSRKRSAKTNTAQRSRKKQCTLCLTCSCNRGSALQSCEDGVTMKDQNPMMGFARTDAELERALIGRLARLEKSASWFDTMCTKVERELKRHRNKMKEKLKENEKDVKPKFLSDVEILNEKDCVGPRLPNTLVGRAKLKTFSFQKSELFVHVVICFLHYES